MEASWVWVFIPIVAILGRVFRDYIKLQTQQRALGSSNRELEKVVEELRQTNRTLGQRVENLETIVVSQTWNAVHAPGTPAAERPRPVAVAPHELPPPPMQSVEELNRQRAEQLARRLGG
jgi:hypothetical protein